VKWLFIVHSHIGSSAVAVARSQAKLLQQQLGQEVLEIRMISVIQSVYTVVKAATDGSASTVQLVRTSSSRCNGGWGMG